MAGEWQPIASAPRDGTPVLTYRHNWEIAVLSRWGNHPDEEGLCGWLSEEYFPGALEEGFIGWNEESDDMPTHWIYPPPKAAS